ncbi:PREDICTED: protein FAR1-RELATED SEQUENCE 5-like [Ipomoea nil]|uniref:protein FAR1-RELATED SEQUENCE 5-like n=1 Tax=Ipomoea nil TaxID=35883 RepID=UPI0009018F37|nr:PREDICTED: protein FAR1-RELATED SEQUENCE 5-like [Ipomoea nil]
MSSVLARQFLKGNRNISSVHQKFILDCAKANIGASKSHGLYSQIVGDYSEVGATVVDFKNVRRDLRAHILGADAQILVHNLIKKQEMCPAFAFDYEVDEDEQMSRLFWADPMSKKNFGAFGDVVSFDATYSTNRYDLIFTPFTGVDNHKKCITFGTGLLLKEDIESYVGPTLNKNEEFKNKLNSIVWMSSLEPPDFEKQWRELMEKTTSHSESENYMYSRFTGPQSSLVEFMMNFDSALKSQRNTNTKLNSDNEGYNPDMKTPMVIEEHASIVYTITVFYQVQEEICASCFKCMVLSVKEDGGMLLDDVMDGKNKIFIVVHNVNDHEAKCSCKMFEMVGLLCRHIFVVFRDLEKIPLKYVVNRWTKDASLKATFEIDGVLYDQNRPKDEKKMLLNKLWSDVHCCIDLAEISEINILPLKHAKNKGSGKRIKSNKELAMEKEKGRRDFRDQYTSTETCKEQGQRKTYQKQQGVGNGKKKRAGGAIFVMLEEINMTLGLAHLTPKIRTNKRHPTRCQPATMLNSQPWMMFGCGMMSLQLRMTNDVSGLECVVFVVSYNHYKLEGEEDENYVEYEE